MERSEWNAYRDSHKDSPGFVDDIEDLTVENNDFRKVVYTATNIQLVLMSLKPDEEIGEEVHDLDQFFRVDEGTGVSILDDMVYPIQDGFSIIIPAGTKHNIINTGDEDLKMYSLYAPPNHRYNVVHSTKEEAESDNEKFDGQITKKI